MKKVAILGCENSHANNFLDLIAKGAYPELEVVGVYSNEREAAQKLHDTYGVRVMEEVGELAGQLDAVMITARHGDNHRLYALPYINDGIPMFIDKPITCTEEDAVALMRLAKEKGIRLCGGSICAGLDDTRAMAAMAKDDSLGEIRGGNVAAPIQPNSPYGGFTFYAQHLVETMMAVFGENIRAVRADQNGSTYTFLARYDGFDVTGTYVHRMPYYHVTIFGSKAVSARELVLTPDSFRYELDEVMALLHGEPMKKSYESFAAPVFVINAIMRALESGAWEDVRPIVL